MPKVGEMSSEKVILCENLVFLDSLLSAGIKPYVRN